MINKPDEVKQILEILIKSGHEAYCTGPALTASYLGRDMSLEWDIYTNCTQEEIGEIFPEGKKLGKRVVRLDYEELAEGEAEGEEAFIIADVVAMEKSIEEELKNYAFTIEAIAEHPVKGIIDPYEGATAIEERRLRAIGDLENIFTLQPYKMLNAVKYASVYGFKLDSELFKAIQKFGPKLMYVNKEYRLDGFEEILMGEYVGRTLKMIGDIGMIPAFVGTKARIEKMGVKDFEKLTKNITMTDDLTMRKVMFYLCFERTYPYAASHLTLDEDERDKLLPVQLLIQNLYFLTTETELKKFINEYGWEKYEFIEEILKVYVKVFERPKDEAYIIKRQAVAEKIKNEKTPVFIEDLAISAEDMIQKGIVDRRMEAEVLLKLLVEDVHRYPERNEKNVLLNYAMKYRTSKLSVMMRKFKKSK